MTCIQWQHLLQYNYFNIWKMSICPSFKVKKYFFTDRTSNWNLNMHSGCKQTAQPFCLKQRFTICGSRVRPLSLKQGGNSIVTNWNPSEPWERRFQGFNRNQGNIRAQIYSICAWALNMHFVSRQPTPQQERAARWSMIPSWENSQCEA